MGLYHINLPLIRHGDYRLLSTTERTGLSAYPGLMVYDTDLNANYVWNGSSWATVGGSGGGTGVVGVVFDGQGLVLTAGTKFYLPCPYAGTITEWDIVADVSGSVVIDVWKDTYANFPPTVADTIAAAAKPTLSSAQKNTDTTLTGWTTTITAGDVFGFNIDSATTVTRVTLVMKVTKS